MESSGPAFFRQVRVGQGGRSFVMYKFRSMYADADKRLDALQEQNSHKAGPLFKIGNDPRVTRVGRFLRRCSLDELPCLSSLGLQAGWCYPSLARRCCKTASTG